MKNKRQQFGFSLIEVLMAIGVLTVGMLMVAGTFPVGIHLTAVSTERTLGAVAADEAFAKIRLYGNAPAPATNRDIFLAALSNTQCEDFNDVLLSATYPVAVGEFLYPSDSTANQVYSWSAICRKNSSIPADTSVQVTVFVSRKVSQGLNYYKDFTTTGGLKPIPIVLENANAPGFTFDSSEVSLTGAIDYITDASTIVIDGNGEIFRVIAIEQNKFWLDRKWPYVTNTYNIWVVPPPIEGGKNPCVGVYQRIINF